MTLTSRRRLIRVTRALVPVAWAAALIALCFIIFVDVETVLFSGPTLFAIGLALAVLGTVARYSSAAAVGIGHCTVCLLFVALVNLRQWSPGRATSPFITMGSLYVFLTAPLALIAWRAAPRPQDPWECATCGYSLRHLPEPRCPECGTPFEPIPQSS